MINLNSINLSQSSSNVSVSPEQITNAVNNYLDNNPITFEETDPNVPEWAKQPNKPTYTAFEVGALPVNTKLFSGSYDDLSNKPVIPTLPDNIVTDPDYVHTDNNFTDAEKEKLSKAITEHQKIKTVNGQSLVGDGNIVISGGGGGSYDDTELREIINSKQDTVTDLESIRSGAAAGSTSLQPVEGKGLSAVDDATVTEDGKLNIEKHDGTVIEFEGGGGLPLSVVNGQLCITFNQ